MAERLVCMCRQVLACFGSAERAALLSHLSVSETLRLIQVRPPLPFSIQALYSQTESIPLFDLHTL